MANSSLWPYQVQQLQARVDREVNAMKGYSAFPQNASIIGVSASDLVS